MMTLKSIFLNKWVRRMGINRYPVQQCVFCDQEAYTPMCKYCAEGVITFKTSDVHYNGFINNRPDIRKHIPNLCQHRIMAVGPHTGRLMALINQFKYGKKVFLAPILAKLLDDLIKDAYSDIPYPQAILPVPTHSLKRISRGFNQTELLGEKIESNLGISAPNHLLQRPKFTHAQAGKSGKQRRSPKWSPFKVKDKDTIKNLYHIALIDDVITTGTTLSQLIHTIRRVNPEIRIDLWCLSVSLPH